MAIALVNTAETFASGSSTTIAAPATSLTAGNLIVVGVRDGGGTVHAVSGVADTAGNYYHRVTFFHSTFGGISLWAAFDTLGNGSNVVTGTFTTASSNRGIVTAQFSGCDPQSPIDTWTNTGVEGTATTITSNAITTSVDEAVLVSLVQLSGSGAWTAGSGYTIAVQDSASVTMLEYKIVASIQTTVTADATNSNGTDRKQILLAAFNAAFTGGGTPVGNSFGGLVVR